MSSGYLRRVKVAKGATNIRGSENKTLFTTSSIIVGISFVVSRLSSSKYLFFSDDKRK